MDLVHKSTFEEELARKRKLIYTNVGDSMMPLLRQGKDLLIIERPKEWDVLPGIVRDGRDISVHDKKYLFYVHMWCVSSGSEPGYCG